MKTFFMSICNRFEGFKMYIMVFQSEKKSLASFINLFIYVLGFSESKTTKSALSEKPWRKFPEFNLEVNHDICLYFVF